MRLADTQAIAVMFGVRPATIRQWARRGKLTRRGRDQKGRALYDLDQVEQLLTLQSTASAAG